MNWLKCKKYMGEYNLFINYILHFISYTFQYCFCWNCMYTNFTEFLIIAISFLILKHIKIRARLSTLIVKILFSHVFQRRWKNKQCISFVYSLNSFFFYINMINISWILFNNIVKWRFYYCTLYIRSTDDLINIIIYILYVSCCHFIGG